MRVKSSRRLIQYEEQSIRMLPAQNARHAKALVFTAAQAIDSSTKGKITKVQGDQLIQ
jgi:hypothetical protein